MKVITKEIRDATIGEFIQAEDVLNSPIKLRIIGSELKKDEVEANSGKMMDKVIFYFENNKKEEKQIGVLSFDCLVRQMNTLDPDIGDILQLETIEVKGSKYLVWKVEIAQKTAEDIPAKEIKTAKEPLPGKTMEKGMMSKEDEQELLDAIPF